MAVQVGILEERKWHGWRVERKNIGDWDALMS